MADHMEGKINIPIGVDFMQYWILFNRLYNMENKHSDERGLITNYIDNLNVNYVRVLLRRNCMLITLLRDDDIIKKRRNSINLSKELDGAIVNKNGDKTILKKTLACIYEIRNNLTHVGRLNSNYAPCLSNFMFYMIHIPTIEKYSLSDDMKLHHYK